jgi:hypothetical protein
MFSVRFSAETLAVLTEVLPRPYSHIPGEYLNLVMAASFQSIIQITLGRGEV